MSEQMGQQPLDRQATLPVSCPHCGASGSVKPTSVGTSKDFNDRVEIKMGCKDCNHTWMVQKLLHQEPPV